MCESGTGNQHGNTRLLVPLSRYPLSTQGAERSTVAIAWITGLRRGRLIPTIEPEYEMAGDEYSHHLVLGTNTLSSESYTCDLTNDHDYGIVSRDFLP